jgi:3-oxoacyl-[acyl-carrier-protein] synthase II
MSRRRVAITGVGLVTALGPSRDTSWARLVEGVCGIGPVTVFDVDGYRSRVAAEVDLDAATAGTLSKLERRRWSRGDQIGVVAADEALEDAGLLESGVDPMRVGVLLGAGTADLLRNERYFATMIAARQHDNQSRAALDDPGSSGDTNAPRRPVHERKILRVRVAGGASQPKLSDAWNHFSSTAADVIAARHGLEGLRSCIVAACSSSTIAIGQAADAIRAGMLDAAIAGGTDALSRLTYSGFNALRLMDAEPCRPFDRSRAGMNIGEGAGMVVLEDLEQAKRRGAHIYGELAGYSASCEAFHATAPEPEGRAVNAMMRAALADAAMPADAVDHINAHGTATPQNDRAEARGFRSVLGDRAAQVPVTSIKSMIGHCLGAAGALEIAVTALTVSRGVVPPTIHHHETDPDCAVDIVANTAREAEIRCAISTSLAFGGNDAAVVITRV